MSMALAVGFVNVSGVDQSYEMLSSCRAVNLNVQLRDAVEYVRDLPEASFGIISAFDFVEHLTRATALALLREARRVLRPGGVMLIKVPNGASPCVGDIYFSDLTHESMWTPASIAQVAVLAGFAHCDVREVGPVPHGVRSYLRHILWQGVRSCYRLRNAIETGSPGSDVMTRVMLVRLS
jgi:SAM-dependent methyltransferase